MLDESTRRNLELTATLAEGKRKGSLLGLMDRTATAMGARKLKQWINYPLVDVDRYRASARTRWKSCSRTRERAGEIAAPSERDLRPGAAERPDQPGLGLAPRTWWP